MKQLKKAKRTKVFYRIYLNKDPREKRYRIVYAYRIDCDAVEQRYIDYDKWLTSDVAIKKLIKSNNSYLSERCILLNTSYKEPMLHAIASSIDN